MHVKSILIGFVVGAVLASVATSLLTKPRKTLEARVSTAPLDSAPLKDLWPESEFYALKFNKIDFGMVEIKDGKIEQVLIADYPSRRQITINARAGQLFGTMSFEQMTAENPYVAKLSYYDDDADGLPDRKVEWHWDAPRKKGGILIRDSISWRSSLSTTTTAKAD